MNHRIIVDTREQKGYVFDNALRSALPAGDYSLETLENCFAIERKSLQDWINTIVHNKERFAKELTKLQGYVFAAVVIEGSIQDIIAGKYRSEIKPAALLGITLGIMMQFAPVQIVFAGDRPHAYAVVKEMLTLGDTYYGTRS